MKEVDKSMTCNPVVAVLPSQRRYYCDNDEEEADNYL
jgi:hypothetical protein